MAEPNEALNRTSRRLTGDISLPAAHAMLYGAGLTDRDWDKAQVAVASLGFEINPCNMHLDRLAGGVKSSLEEAGLRGWVFHAIGVSDGISMGTEGMKYSLPSRDLIADCDRGSCRRPLLRCAGGGPRLRQEHARLADGHGPAEPARDHGLRRDHPRRALAGPRPEHCLRVRGLRRVPRSERSTAKSSRRSSATPAPARAPAAGCTPPTPWPRRSRPWG